jgi:hypothetical protein
MNRPVESGAKEKCIEERTIDETCQNKKTIKNHVD